MPNSLPLLAASALDRDLDAFLQEIWRGHFADVPRMNTVSITYGKPWKRRLGCIRISLDTTLSVITINTLLRHTDVPVSVLMVTIAHELAHYSHGFGSPLPRLYKHPHANGVVTRELEKRGLGDVLQQCNAWINFSWFEFYETQRASGRLASLPTDQKALVETPEQLHDACAYYHPR